MGASLVSSVSLVMGFIDYQINKIVFTVWMCRFCIAFGERRFLLAETLGLVSAEGLALVVDS